MHTRRLLGALALTGLVAILSLAACATPTTSPSPAATGSPAAGTPTSGAAVESGLAAVATPSPTGCCVKAQCAVDRVALTVLEVRRELGAEFVTPEPGEILLVTDVTIENTGDDEEPYNPLYFRLRAGDGTEYSASVFAPNPSLRSGNLQPGDKVRGNVAFIVPRDAEGLTLIYEPLVFFDSEEIRVDLSCTATPTPSS